MKISLTNNDNLELRANSSDTTTSVSNNFKEKATGIIITDCPKIDAKDVVDSVKTYQSSRTKNLKAIRFQLPYDQNTSSYRGSGTFDTLTGYTVFGNQHMSGYDGFGNVKYRPAIIGTWGLTDYVDQTMCNALTAEVDGYFNVSEPAISADYFLNWDEIAVQCVDPTKRNYNPAAAIILNSKSLGTVHNNTQHFSGKWWLTNAEAAQIGNIYNWFAEVGTVTDTNGIVSNDTSRTYQFTNFDSFSGFTGIKSVAVSAFGNNANLQSIRLPSSLESLAPLVFNGCSNMTSVGEIPTGVTSIPTSAFNGCTKMTTADFGDSITEIEDSAFKGCEKLETDSLPSNIGFISNSAFQGCSSITISEIPASVGFIGQDAFNGCSSIPSLHIKRYNEKVSALSGAFDGGTYPIYVGTTDSAWYDGKIKEACSRDSSWSPYMSRIESWYKKEYTGKLQSVSGTYEIQDYVNSDGIQSLTTPCKYETGTKFVSDVSFASTPANSGDSIHGSSSHGLKGSVSQGLLAKVDGVTTVVTQSGKFADGTVHNYVIDLKNSNIKKDDADFYSSPTPTTGDNSTITFFGDGTNKFIGSSWMNRFYKNGVLTHDFVPVLNKNTNKVGFYDVENGTFIGGDYYSSDSAVLGIGDGNSNSFVTEDGDILIF